MKLIRRIMAIAAILPVMLSCSGNNESKAADDNVSGTTVEEALPAKVDVERLSEMMKNSSKDMKSEDYDFLLDQLEIIAKPTDGMSKEERQTYMKGLDNDMQGAIIVISMGLQSGKKKGVLTEKQLERFDDLQKRYP